jgi:hypothetical protein
VADAVVGEVRGIARWIRAEEASWNAWPGRRMRLFNHRWAWVVHLDLEGPGTLAWQPSATTLELNDPSQRLTAAALPDEVLSDLVFWALQQERAASGDDLVSRLRAAGPFRAAYLPAAGERHLAGVIAFPAAEHAEQHVVAARLTVAVELDGEPMQMEFVFQ